MRSERLPGLDGLRGLAILAVFLYHVAFFGGTAPAVPFDRLLLGAALHGWMGVDLFFVLSGFLITGILLDSRDAPGALGTFYLRRVRRIVPAYAVILLVQLVWYGLQGEFALTRPLWAATWTTNILIAREGWQAVPSTMQHFWSLAVEEQFYLLWPLLALRLTPRALGRVALGAVILGSLCRVALAQGGNPVAGYVLLPARMDGLAVGALLALAVRSPAGIEAALRRWTIAGGIALLVLLARLLSRHALEYGDPIMLAFGLNAMVIVMGAALLRAVAPSRSPIVRRFLERGPLPWLAPYSYALYLWHQPVLVCLTTLGLTAGAVPALFGSALPGYLVLVLVAGSLSLGLAMLSRRWVELPFLRSALSAPPGS